MQKLHFFLVPLLTLLIASCDNVSSGPNLAGTWQGEYVRFIEGDTPEFAETLPITLTLTQSGNALFGKMSSPEKQDSTVTGTVIGSNLTLTVSDATTVLLTGKVEEANLEASALIRDVVNYNVTLSVNR